MNRQSTGTPSGNILSRQQLLERQLNEVQAIAHVGIWEYFAASGKFVWSDETCRILGIDSNGCHGTIDTYLAAVHPDDRGKVDAWMEQARSVPANLALEHRIVWPAGQVRYLMLQGEPFQDEDGYPALAGTIRDITDIKQTSEALGIVSRKLVNALESMTDAFCMLDKSYRFTYLNGEAERLLRREHGELLGKLLWDEFPHLLGSSFEQEVRRCLEQERPTAFEHSAPDRQGWKEFRVYPSADGLALYFTDITERKRLQELEQRSEERFRIIAKATTDIIWEWDAATDRFWWNEGLQTMFGFDPHELDGGVQAWAAVIHPAERERVLRSFNAAMASRQESWSEEYRFMRKDGSYADVRDHGIFIRNDAGAVVSAIGSMVDISAHKRSEAARREAEARNRFQASMLDKAHDAISVMDMDHRITYWNQGAQRLFGWRAEDVIGKAKGELMAATTEDLYKEFHQGFQLAMQEGDWRGEGRKKCKSGGIVMVESHLTLVRDDAGLPQYMLEIETDITQRKAAEQAIAELAFFDPLTRLPNRRLLQDRLRHALAACTREGRTGALLFLDLDNFKSLNDTLGHDKGDILLQQVAQRLSACVPRASDTVARLGGDEFVIVLEDASGSQAKAAAQAEAVAEKILAAFHAPFQLDGHSHHTSPSIGVALFDRQVESVDELLKRADVAMYQAKGAGRNTVRFFDPDMQALISARVELEADLRQGLQHGEFHLHYQRQTDGQGRTIGAEALVRWLHPRRGLVSPVLFIPLAEETGLIQQLGQCVLEAACKQLVVWAARTETAHLTVAVNVSPRQFRQPAFVEQVLNAVRRAGANPERLKLELTESILVTDVEQTVAKMNMLKSNGIGFALDDFGTGYSSLSYLKRLPLDQLKIDRSFVKDILVDPNDAAIARTILGLGHTLGLDVIAEGVETARQRDFLAEHGCRSYQGFLFSRPVPAEQF